MSDSVGKGEGGMIWNSRGRGRLRRFLELRRPWGFSPEAGKPGVLQSMGSQSDTTEYTQATAVFLPGKSHEERNLVGYSPWRPTELDMTEHV